MNSGDVATKPLSIFISYAPRDEEYLNELESHLTVLTQRGLIQAWSRKDLTAGTETTPETLEKLRTSDIILFLISSDALKSDDFWKVEMPIALARHRNLEATVIPILLRPVYWEGPDLAELQVLPKDQRPVESWERRDDAYAHIASEIGSIARGIHKNRKERAQYRQFLEEHLGDKRVISSALRSKLTEYSQQLSLSLSEISYIEQTTLQQKIQEAELRALKIEEYGRYYAKVRKTDDLDTIQRKRLDEKATNFGLLRSDSDVRKLENDLERELFSSAKRKNKLSIISLEGALNILQENSKTFLWSGSALAVVVSMLAFTVFRLVPDGNDIVASPSPSPSLSLSPSPSPSPPLPVIAVGGLEPTEAVQILEQTEAVQIIERWLGAKARIYGPDYDIALAETLATGDLIADIRDPNPNTGNVSKLKKNNAYYVYNNSHVQEVGEFYPIQNSAKIIALVYEELALFKNGALIQSDNSEPQIYSYFLVLENGDWKISAYCRCIDDKYECSACQAPYDN